MRIVQITEQDKMELGEKGHRAVKSVHEFLECLDRISGGEISQEMAEYYGERRGVPGTGPYSRYNRRDDRSYSGHYEERNPYDERRSPYYGDRGDNYRNRYEY